MLYVCLKYLFYIILLEIGNCNIFLVIWDFEYENVCFIISLKGFKGFLFKSI